MGGKRSAQSSVINVSVRAQLREYSRRTCFPKRYMYTCMRAKNINIEKTNRKKKVGGNACRGSNSRPQTQSCTQAMWTGGLFSFFEKKSIAMHTAHARATHGTQRAQTWMTTCPKPVPSQGTQSCGKPCRFQRDAYGQKTTIRKLDDIWYEITPQEENPANGRTPLATHWTGRAQTSTTVSGRPSSVDLRSICANGARTKR